MYTGIEAADDAGNVGAAHNDGNDECNNTHYHRHLSPYLVFGQEIEL